MILIKAGFSSSFLVSDEAALGSAADNTERRTEPFQTLLIIVLTRIFSPLILYINVPIAKTSTN